MAPKIPNKRPMIYMTEGIYCVTMAEKTTTRIVCVLTKAEIGPIGAPVEKALITKIQPITLKKEARNPLIHFVKSKEPSLLVNAMIPMI